MSSNKFDMLICSSDDAQNVFLLFFSKKCFISAFNEKTNSAKKKWTAALNLMNYLLNNVVNMITIPHVGILIIICEDNFGAKIAKPKRHICFVHFWPFSAELWTYMCLDFSENKIILWCIYTFWNCQRMYFQKKLLEMGLKK